MPSAPTLERRTEPIDPRIAARRDQVARDRGRRVRRRVILLSSIVLLVVGAWFLTRTALLDVDRIDVTGTAQTSPDEVLSASGITTGEQLVDVDTGAARSRILALPWVRDASVRINWPDKVSISVTERQPVAAVAADDGTWYLVDGQGRVLAPTTDPSWVAVEGLTAGAVGSTIDTHESGALDLVVALSPGLHDAVQTVVVDSGGTLSLRLRSGVTVLVGGSDQLQAKLDSLRTFLSQVDLTNLASIDVRVPDRVAAVRSAPGGPAASSTAGGGNG